MLNYIRNLLSDDYYFTWEAESAQHPFINKKVITSNFQLLEESCRGSTKYFLYIDDIGGYVEPGTKLFIRNGRVYRDLS